MIDIENYAWSDLLVPEVEELVVCEHYTERKECEDYS